MGFAVVAGRWGSVPLDVPVAVPVPAPAPVSVAEFVNDAADMDKLYGTRPSQKKFNSDVNELEYTSSFQWRPLVMAEHKSWALLLRSGFGLIKC